MEARYFRYQYENTQDGILQSGCIWDRRVDKKTTYLYAAGEYAGIPRIARDQEKKWGRKAPETILDIFVLGAYTVPYICRLLEILQEQGVRTVVLPYIPPMIRMNMMTYLEKNGTTDRELQRFLGAPYSYLKEQGVTGIIYPCTRTNKVVGKNLVLFNKNDAEPIESTIREFNY